MKMTLRVLWEWILLICTFSGPLADECEREGILRRYNAKSDN